MSTADLLFFRRNPAPTFVPDGHQITNLTRHPSRFGLPWKKKPPLIQVVDKQLDAHPPTAPQEYQMASFTSQHTTNPSNDTSQEKERSNGVRLKRRSVQLLRMISDRRSKDVPEYETTTSTHVPFVPTHSPLSPTAWSTPSLTSFSPQSYTPLTPRDLAENLLNDRAESHICNTTPFMAPPVVSKTSPISPMADPAMSIPPDRPYPYITGDSPFHQTILGGLRPRHSRAPNNTPDTSCSLTPSPLSLRIGTRNLNTYLLPTMASKKMTTCESLINAPLPPPDGQPNRYVVYLKTDTDVDINIASTARFQVPDVDQPVVRGSSALDDLWEYGSSTPGSLCDSESDSSEDGNVSFVANSIDADGGESEESVEPALDSSTTRRSEVNSGSFGTFPSPPDSIALPHPYITVSPERPISSAVSLLSQNTGSYLEDVNNTEAKVAYRLPLKFARPQATPKSYGGSPFAALYAQHGRR